MGLAPRSSLPPEMPRCSQFGLVGYRLSGTKTIYPFIDQAQMKKVQSRQNWFLPAELKEK